ncbi:alpha amylase N-terminal ig-like domain-containing protein [bacterium]|nr:alpha amylase N-terminal ig-like domain-containing protein [bacterium]
MEKDRRVAWPGLFFYFILVALPYFGCHRRAPALRQVTVTYQPVIAGELDVFIAGTFNDWNSTLNRMTDEDGDGVYEASLLLAPGRYEYKFVVNGEWKTDFNAEEFMGAGQEGDNAVLYVDDRYTAVSLSRGDGDIYYRDLHLETGYRMLDPYADGSLRVTVPAMKQDVERVRMHWSGVNGAQGTVADMELKATGPLFDYYQVLLDPGGRGGIRFFFSYEDGDSCVYAGAGGFSAAAPAPDQWFVYDPEQLAPFKTPDWAKEGIFYQIFPDRFRNGDPDNDPDFSESYFRGRHTLPPGGKTNDEYFHMEAWDSIGGLVHSPYRTDGKPDYYSFYGGDIAGVMEKLDYLEELGVTIIYFNPLNQAKSNHKYDPVDYLKIDSHFADEPLFKRFTAAAREHGIRIIVDKAFNHTGDEHFAFVDTRERGEASPYWHWYEWHTWPLPPEGAPTPNDYYDCWWGFPLHPNLNFDLSRPNRDENMIRDITAATPNREVVEYLLSVADYWIGTLGIDGFRLDVPNEVPFWFWKLFRQRVESLDRDAYLIGEIWGDALPWLGEDGFHSTMNYKYFRDPVLDFFASRKTDAQQFDEAMAPGRVLYPREALLAMMNLIDSHDTVRFLTQAGGDIRRLELAVLFQMTYVGIPQIYYGDEVALQGGKDPDNRRPFP